MCRAIKFENTYIIRFVSYTVLFDLVLPRMYVETSENSNSCISENTRLIKVQSGVHTVETVVLFCALKRHITHFLRVLLQIHELTQRVLLEMKLNAG